MPELPEVETVVRGLRRRILGRRIKNVWGDTPKLIKGMPLTVFRRRLKGRKIEGVRRLAKNILIDLDGQLTLLVHFKMTGHFLWGRWKIKAGRLTDKPVPIEPKSIKERVNGYVRLILVLDNGWMLGLSDLRKFAKVVLGKTPVINNLPELRRVGPEAIDKNLKFEEFKKRIGSGGRAIKQVLLDQEKISGLGNIYADETLWRAGVNPLKKADSLKDKEFRKLFLSSRIILQKSIRLGGASIDDYRDVSGRSGGYGRKRLVYGREGEKCRRCGGLIKRIKIGGRSAHYCPVCQR